jgi:hypothetical protein
MIKLCLVFLVFATCIHLGITSWRALSGKEKWSLTKSVGYSVNVALLTVLAMIIIVMIF